MSATQRAWLRMSYRHCGMEWTDEWPAPLNLECPECGEVVEPYAVSELRPRRGEETAADRVSGPEFVGKG